MGFFEILDYRDGLCDDRDGRRRGGGGFVAAGGIVAVVIITVLGRLVDAEGWDGGGGVDGRDEGGEVLVAFV